MQGVNLVSSHKQTGDSVRLGIRPQHLRIDEQGNLSGKITLVERLGTETIVELVSEQDTPFRFATTETLAVTSGEKLRFSFAASDAHLF